MGKHRSVILILLFSLLAHSASAYVNESAALVNPQNDSYINGVVSVNITFSGAANITIHYNQSETLTLLNTSNDESSPYIYPWNTSELTDGIYGLRVIVVNSSDGNDNASLHVFNLTLDNTPPRVFDLVSSDYHPANSSVLINVSVNVSDAFGVGAVNLNNGSASYLMQNLTPDANTTYRVQINLTDVNCQEEELCVLTVIADDLTGNTNDSVTTRSEFNGSSGKYVRPLYLDTVAPSVSSSAATNGTHMPGFASFLSVLWDDVSLNDQGGPSLAVVTFYEFNGSTITDSYTPSQILSAQLTRSNYTNLTVSPRSGENEGFVTHYNVTLTDTGNQSAIANVTLVTQNVSPTIDVVNAANGSVFNSSFSLRFSSIERGVGLNISSLLVNASQGSSGRVISYADNTSLFDCSCSDCNTTQSNATNNFVANYTCEMVVNWTQTGRMNLTFTISDLYGNTNTTLYEFVLATLPSIVNVSVNDVVIAQLTSEASVAGTVSAASKEMTFNWSVDAASPINTTVISFVNVTEARATSQGSLPASVRYNVTAGKNYLKINVTLENSTLTDEVQINFTADVPLNFSLLSAQYSIGQVISWSVLDNGTDVTSEERFVNETFDIIVNVSNSTDTVPYQARFNYSNLDGLALRWNASTTSFGAIPASAALLSNLTGETRSNITVAVQHDGQTGVFFDGEEYLVAATFNLSVANRTPFYRQRNVTGGMNYLLTECSTAPSTSINASQSCYTNTSDEVTVFLPRFDVLDTVFFGEFDATGPNVTLLTPSVTSQSVLNFHISVLSPNPNATLCSYNLSRYNESTNLSTPISVTTVPLTSFSLNGTAWEYQRNFSPSIDADYNISVTCTDSQGHVGMLNTTVEVADTTKPSIFDVAVSGIAAREATISGTANEYVTFSVEYGTENNSLDQTVTQAGTSLTASITLEDLLTDTRYYYNLTACDVEDNCNSSDTGTFRTAETSGSGGGGGGGGGGGAGEPRDGSFDADSSESRIWQNVEDALDYIPKVNTLTRILVEFGAPSRRVEISIKEFSEKPEGTKALERHVYKYFEITHKGLETATKHVIEFSVEKQWLRDNGMDASSVRLYRLHDDAWVEYRVIQLEDQRDRYTFSASVPGFSWFAIAGVDQVLPVEPQAAEPATVESSPPAEEQPAEVTNESDFVSALGGNSERGGSIILWIVGVLVLSAGLAIGGLKFYQVYKVKDKIRQKRLAEERRNFAASKGGRAVTLDREDEHDPMADVHHYIVAMRAQGFDNEHIKQRLLSAGWDSVIVDQELSRK